MSSPFDSKWKTWLVWPGWLLLAAALLWTWARRTQPGTLVQGRPPAPQVGFPAPDFTLPTLEGSTLRLSDLRGQAVILNFWASWCPPCKAEMPALQRVYEAYQPQGLVVVAVNVTAQDARPNVEAFVAEHGLTFPVALDLDARVAAAYRVHSLPTTFFIGPDGVIHDIVIGGPMAEALLRQRAEALLALKEK
ncbi:MAG: TlpA family protein disulfide reductase [Chloroflexi bacterium]|nr:TlpA family protein disulfide reductase [Chloroflexota bacterium]